MRSKIISDPALRKAASRQCKRIGLCWNCGWSDVCGLWNMTRPCATKTCSKFKEKSICIPLKLGVEKNASNMELHGQALLDYLSGNENTKCILRRNDGIAYPPLYAKQFFYPEGLPKLDRMAIEHCSGRVLDIGAGAGTHSLAIQDRGLDVTSVDISRNAVQVMKQRNVANPVVGDVFDSYPGFFNTVLIIQNIGIVQDLEGLDRFLKHLDGLLAPGGQLITDSFDPRHPTDQADNAYQQDRMSKEVYPGGRTLRLEYQDKVSDWFEWMRVDPDTLQRHVQNAGFRIKNLGADGGRYLVSITNKKGSA